MPPAETSAKDVLEEAAAGQATDAAPRREYHAAAARLLDGRGFTITTVLADFVMLALAAGSAIVGARAADVSLHGSEVLLVFPPLVMALIALRGMYTQRITIRILDEAAHVAAATSIAAMSIVAITAFSGAGLNRADLIARAWVFGTLYLVGNRLVLYRAQRRARAERAVGKPTLIVGAGRVGAQVEHRLEALPQLGLDPIGYVDEFPPPADQVARNLPVLGPPAELQRIVETTGAQHVVLAFLSSRGSDARLAHIARECEDLGLEVSLVPRLFENINVRVGLEHIGGMPLFRLRAVHPKGWQYQLKHAVDGAVAAFLVVLLAPVLLMATLAVKLSSPGPVFFRQRRVGRDGRPFELLKFRSMREEENAPDDKVALLLPEDTAPGGVEGADRRTRVGKFLRNTSIDELPQLFNVLKGEMSIVGPRPERPEYAEMFEHRLDRYGDRLRVKAGITGWAQVHGYRGKTSLSDRVEWDNYYIENWSLWLDIKILLMTVGALWKHAE